MSNTRTFRRRVEAGLARLGVLPPRHRRRRPALHWRLPRLASTHAGRRRSPFHRREHN